MASFVVDPPLNIRPLQGQDWLFDNAWATWFRTLKTTAAAAGPGTVTTVSVATANGFAGTVATPGTTPAITLTTTITGLLKGNGTAISAAVAGTDYALPSQTFFLGTTSIAINRASAAIVLTGITSIDGNAATVTTNANLTGPITSVGNATAVASQTGTGTKFVMDNGPTFIGIPAAPTAAAATNTTQLATTAFVQAAVSAAVAGLLNFKGATDCSTNPNYPAAAKGDSYIVTVAGRIGGASGTQVEIGDWYVATAANAGGTEAAVGTSWGHMEHNLVGALLASNNLSDLANAATARNNLGLGTAAVATASAVSKVDDTNVTLTLGGTIATALLQAISFTLGWTGLLASSRGGTGNGFTKFAGPTTAEKTKTLRDSNDTILELGGNYTPTGSWTFTNGSMTLDSTSPLWIYNENDQGVDLKNWLLGVNNALMQTQTRTDAGVTILVTFAQDRSGNTKHAGRVFDSQGAPASKAAGSTLTAAEVLGGMAQYTGAAGTLTLPTGTAMDSGVNTTLVSADQGCWFSVINTGSGTATVTAGVTFTIVGGATVAAAASGLFRCRRTAANTWIAYRSS